MNAEQVIGAYFDWEEKQPGVITNCEAFQAGAAYAATLHQAARVDEEAVSKVWQAIADHPDNPIPPSAASVRAALEAALSDQPLIHESGAISSESGQPAERQGEAINVELEREIHALCKPFDDPPPSWVNRHIRWLREHFPAATVGVPDELRALSERASEDWRVDDRKIGGGSVLGGAVFHYTNGSGQTQLASFSCPRLTDDDPRDPTEVQSANARFAVECVNFVRNLLAAAPSAPHGVDRG